MAQSVVRMPYKLFLCKCCQAKQDVQQVDDIIGQKVYGIDKTLLVPLVQPSVDIVQGQVSQQCSCSFSAAIIHTSWSGFRSCT